MDQRTGAEHSANVIRLRERQWRTGAVVRVNGKVELHQHNLAGTRTRVSVLWSSREERAVIEALSNAEK